MDKENNFMREGDKPHALFGGKSGATGLHGNSDGVSSVFGRRNPNDNLASPARPRGLFQDNAVWGFLI